MKKHRSSLTFKIATESQELEAIHRLNYRTFVEEIRNLRAVDSQVGILGGIRVTVNHQDGDEERRRQDYEGEE